MQVKLSHVQISPDALTGSSSSANAVSRIERFFSFILPPNSWRLRDSSVTPEKRQGRVQGFHFFPSQAGSRP